MSLVSFLPYIYSVMGLIMISAYIPQIRTLLKGRGDCRDLSLTTWWIWTVGSVVNSAYGWWVLADFRYTFFCVVTLILCAVITGLIHYRRRVGLPGLRKIRAIFPARRWSFKTVLSRSKRV